MDLSICLSSAQSRAQLERNTRKMSFLLNHPISLDIKNDQELIYMQLNVIIAYFREISSPLEICMFSVTFEKQKFAWP